MRSMVCLAVAAACAAGTGLRVGVLSGHENNAWNHSTGCTTGSSADLIQCNLNLYSNALAAAASASLDLIVLPEAYGQAGIPTERTLYEPLVTQVGAAPCDTANATATPQQARLSCSAREHGIAVAGNVFTSLANGTHRITEVVYGRGGEALAVYHKHHLFPNEVPFFKPGPFAPTTFHVAGVTLGIVICYEGVYGPVYHDWAQYDALVHDQGATAIAWSAGGIPDLKAFAHSIADRYNVSVLASDQGESVVANPDSYIDVAIPGLKDLGYTGNAVVRSTTL